MFSYKNKKVLNKKIPHIAITSLLVISVMVLIIYLEKSGKINLYESNNTNIQNLPTQGEINYDPPTEIEAQEGNEQKERLIENNDTQIPNTANIVIVDASQYGQDIEVRAFVSNIVKDGACIITFEKNGKSFSKNVDAVADATTTPCINVVVPRNEFDITGEWKVTVAYESTSLTGASSTTLTIK